MMQFFKECKSLSVKAQGISLFLCALLLFGVFDASSKYLLAADLPAVFLNAMRYLAFLGVGLVVLLYGGVPRWSQVMHKRVLIWRGIALGAAGTCFMTALTWMPLGEATALYFTAPLMVVAASPWMLGESVGREKWAAVAVGFIGMQLIVRPGGALPLLGTGLMIMAAICFAAYQLFTRRLSVLGVPIHVQYGSTAIVCLIITGLPVPFFLPDPWPSVTLICAIILACLCNAAGHLLLIAAFERVAASTLAPLNYLQLTLAVFFSIVLFGAMPDILTFFGIVFVIIAGVFIALQRSELREKN